MSGRKRPHPSAEDGSEVRDAAKGLLSASAEEELRRLLAKKQSIETNLLNLEKQIYALETSYLEDTQNGGNLLRVC
jgi:hypothetical protein